MSHRPRDLNLVIEPPSIDVVEVHSVASRDDRSLYEQGSVFIRCHP